MNNKAITRPIEKILELKKIVLLKLKELDKSCQLGR
jgi:hypothetical protein